MIAQSMSNRGSETAGIYCSVNVTDFHPGAAYDHTRAHCGPSSAPNAGDTTNRTMVFSLVCDVAFESNGDMRWETTANFTLAGGIAGALLAAVPGLLDLLGLRDPRERRVATTHLVLNLAIVAVADLVVSGWLGGQLVHVFGVTQPHHESATPAPQDRLHPRT
jgi:uncharacterized membrane protein